MNLSSSYSDILISNNSLTISHQRNASTSPKRIQLKDQIIQQITTLISLELNKIDSKEIETKLSIYFNLTENNEANNYIKIFTSTIDEVKKNLNFKVKNFLNHNINALIDNIKASNNNIINSYNNLNENELIMKNKFKLILKEIKVLNNNSRIKFKKLYDNLSNEYDKILSTVYDYLQKGNTKLVIDRLNRVEQLKNDVLFDVTSIENIQNKFTDSIKNIINKIKNDKPNDNNIKSENNININKNNNNTRYSLGRTKTGYFTFNKNNNKNFNINFNYANSDNNLYNKLSKNKIDISNFNTYGNIYYNNNKDENECVKVYRIKLKEKKDEIEKLKQQLEKEKESKNKAINELNKLQYSNKMTLNIKNSQKNATNEEKFNKLTEMIIGFTYSMNNLRNNLYQKTISHMDAKNIYGKLKTKLIALIEEASSLKNNLTNDNNNIKENIDEDFKEENDENNSDIKTIKEENENSQIFTDRDKDFNNKNQESIESNSSNNNNNNNAYNKQQTGGNIVNNNITLNTLPNYNIQVLLEENKNLREQLSQKLSEKNNEQDKNKNLIESLKKQINDLKKIILEKDKEIEEKRNNSIKSEKDELNNIIINNTKNIEQLKKTYQILIDDKDNRIKELEEEIILYEKENDVLKEEKDKLKSESRKDKILSEAEVNNLKNQKIELQCLLEQGNSGNNLININNKEEKEKVKKMENEINIKNKQITLLTQNHENDLKELNLAIEMLKQKILQLEEENNNISSNKELNKDHETNE